MQPKKNFTGGIIAIMIFFALLITGCGTSCDNDGICDWLEKAANCTDCAECGNGIVEAGEECEQTTGESTCSDGYVCSERCSCEPAIPIAELIESASLRSGPGANYPEVGVLSPNDTAEVIGVSQNGDWWKITVLGGNELQGWIRIASVRLIGDTNEVPVVSAPPAPEGAGPTEPTGPKERPECCYVKGPTAIGTGICTCPCPPEQSNPVPCTK